MARLNQINALVTGRKSEIEKFVGDIHKIMQKEALFNGFERIYKPMDEEKGEKLLPERQKIQQNVDDLLHKSREKWTELWNLTVTQDSSNQAARSSVEVDGKVILVDVPVTTLLFLEKQLNDVETMISKVPTPNAAEEWTYDSNAGLLRGNATQSIKTKKEATHYEKAPATKEHPAQVEFFYKDVTVGTWTTVPQSSAMPMEQKSAILHRIRKLKDAVKLARENANMLEVKNVEIGKPIFEFLLGK